MKSICGISLNGALIALALVALLGSLAAMQTQAADKQRTTTTNSEKHETAQEIISRTRIAQGYSVTGPIELQGVSSSELVLAYRIKKSPSTVSLKNRKVSVMDEVGNGLTMSSVKAGTNVIICQKMDRVIIYVVPSIKKESGDAN